MAGGAAAPLYQGAVNRETRVARHVQQRLKLCDFSASHQIGVNPVAPHGVTTFCKLRHIGVAMAQKHSAAGREHHIIIQLVAQMLPHFEAKFEEVVQGL